MPYVFFLFICIVWGSSFILMDRAAVALGPLAIGTGRLLVGSCFLAVAWWVHGSRLPIERRDWGHILLVALLANAWPFVVLPLVMTQANEHGYFGMLVALVPLVTILASIPTLGVWPTRRQLFGVLGGLVCLLGIVQDGSDRGIPFGVLALGLTVPVSYALGNTYIKWKLDHLSPLPITVLFLGIGGLLLLPLNLFPALLESWKLGGPPLPQHWPTAIVALGFLGIFSTGLAILMFVHLVKHQGPLFAGMVTYVIPLIALAWGQFDSERLTSLQVTAMAGVLAMVALVQWGSSQQTEPEAPREPLV